MARRKIGERNVRSLNKISNGKSYSVTLPIEVVRRWRWQRSQRVMLTIDNKRRRIILEDWKR